jgi:type I restriction enzyme M protein
MTLDMSRCETGPAFAGGIVAGGSSTQQQRLPERGKLEVKTLESWLWEAAGQVRGPLDAPKFKGYILPLIFLKRLSDVFDDEVARVAESVGGIETAGRLVGADHALVRFYIPAEAPWEFIGRQTTKLGEILTYAVRTA